MGSFIRKFYHMNIAEMFVAEKLYPKWHNTPFLVTTHNKRDVPRIQNSTHVKVKVSTHTQQINFLCSHARTLLDAFDIYYIWGWWLKYIYCICIYGITLYMRILLAKVNIIFIHFYLAALFYSVRIKSAWWFVTLLLEIARDIEICYRQGCAVGGWLFRLRKLSDLWCVTTYAYT